MKKISLLFLICLDVSADQHIRSSNVDEICNTTTAQFRRVTESIKRRVYIRDGVIGGNHTGICEDGCEVDHRVSLELGGSNDISNLAIQPYSGKCNAHDKDRLENKLHSLVCAGTLKLDEAQSIIYSDWVDGYKRFMDANGCD